MAGCCGTTTPNSGTAAQQIAEARKRAQQTAGAPGTQRRVVKRWSKER